MPIARTVPSPCRNICRLGRRAGERICLGCGRTPDEIKAWPTADDGARRAIRSAAGRRLAARHR